MKRIFFIAIIFTVNLWASSSIGSATAQFLEVNVHPRNMGMGNALTSLADGAAAVLVNPAGIVDLGENHKFDSYLSYLNWPADISFGSMNAAYKFGVIGTFGVNVTYVNYGDELRTTQDNPMGEGTFSMASNSIGLSYGRYLTDKFSFGLTAKFISENYDGISYHQLAYDMGSMYRAGFRNLTIGMSILHFSRDAQFDGTFTDYSDMEKMAAGELSEYESWSLPMTFRSGISIDAYQSNVCVLKVAFDMIHTNNTSEEYCLGTELQYMNMFFVRAGYQFETDIEGLSAGLGANLKGIRVDYAFNAMDYFGARHRFALGYSF